MHLLTDWCCDRRALGLSWRLLGSQCPTLGFDVVAPRLRRSDKKTLRWRTVPENSFAETGAIDAAELSRSWHLQMSAHSLNFLMEAGGYSLGTCLWHSTVAK